MPDSKMQYSIPALLALVSGFTSAASAEVEPSLQAAIASEFRSKDAVRDKYRHPAETLTFFQVKPTDTVIEITPGGGWYSNILGPYLAKQGKLIAASFPHDARPAFRGRMGKRFEAHVAKNAAQFATTEVIHFYPPANPSMGEAIADVVVTFRNTHNWINDGVEQQVVAAAFKALKPGGVFGVVQHRGREGANPQKSAGTGYVPSDYVIKLATEAGFVLEARSEVNANPKDIKAYRRGVWTLPPSLRLGERDKAKYLAIGESDRMTLRFRKPRD